MFNDWKFQALLLAQNLKKIIEKGYKSEIIDKHILAVEKFDRNGMLKEKTNLYSTNSNFQSLLSKHQ